MGNCQNTPPGAPIIGSFDITPLFSPILTGQCPMSKTINGIFEYTNPGWYAITWTPFSLYSTTFTLTETSGRHPCSLSINDMNSTGYVYLDASGDYNYGYTATFGSRISTTCSDGVCLPCVSTAKGVITVRYVSPPIIGELGTRRRKRERRHHHR